MVGFRVYAIVKDEGSFGEVFATLDISRDFIGIEKYFDRPVGDFMFHFFRDDNTKVTGGSRDAYGSPYRVCTHTKELMDALRDSINGAKARKERPYRREVMLYGFLKAFNDRNMCDTVDEETFLVLEGY